MNYPAFKTFTFYLFCGISVFHFAGNVFESSCRLFRKVLFDNFLQALRRDAALVGSLLLSAGPGPGHPGCR